MRIGVLTGGGDTAALNAILYGAASFVEDRKHEVVGFLRGWAGVLDNDKAYEIIKDEKISPLKARTGGRRKLSSSDIDMEVGGTLIKTSRVDLTKVIDGMEDARRNIEKSCDAFIAIGGDDTLSVGRRLNLSIPHCFVTKTIDNDVGKNGIYLDDIINYFTPGFPTATARIQEYATRLRTTCYGHDRIMFLEAMGRNPGWLALASYQAEPDFIIIPECPLNYPAFLKELLEKYRKKDNVIVVVSEGAKYDNGDLISVNKTEVDSFGHAKLGEAAKVLAKKVKYDADIENCNSNNPDLYYRSGSPTNIDCVFSYGLGIEAAKSVLSKERGLVAVLQRRGQIIRAITMPIDEAVDVKGGKIIPRTVDPRFYDPATYSITEAGKEYFRPILGGAAK